jgi:tetratricopeptide (TPR) repeat protein
MALKFLASSSPNRDIERVLFEIEIDYRTICAPFADISQLSKFPDEQETLFMASTRFLLGSRHQEELNADDGSSVRYWLVKLKLLSDYDLHSARELEAADAPRKTVKNCVDALSEMLEMVSSEDVQLVFDMLASLYPRETNWIAAVRLYCLAMLEFENNDDDYKMVVSYHEQAIAIWQKYYLHDVELNCYFNIAESHFALGELFGYSVENQKNLSVYHWEQALHFYELALPGCATVATDYARVSVLYKLGRVCRNLLRSGYLERYGLKAVTYQKEWMELMLLQKHVVSTSRQIAAEFQELADIYAAIHQYDDALSNYEKAVNLYLSNDNDEAEHWTSSYDLIDLYKKIVTICTEHTRNFGLALKYQLLEHECKLKKLKEDAAVDATLCDGKARYLAESHFFVADCYINTEQYVAAHKHLTEGLEHIRESRELLLRDGRTVVRCGDRYLLVPLAADDNRLKDCEFRIEEKEEKLRIVQLLLEKS